MNQPGRSALIVVGTGPSGVSIVEQFLAAGYTVTIYHTGSDIPAKLSQRRWDVVIGTYGRLRSLADHLAGRVQQVVGITGQPVYLGTMLPTPAGTLPLPIQKRAPRRFDATNHPGKVAAGEDQLLEQHRRGDFEAVVVGYPGVYGPRGSLSHEWAVVRRILDHRPRMILPHDGITCFHRGYVENLGRPGFLAGRLSYGDEGRTLAAWDAAGATFQSHITASQDGWLERWPSRRTS